MGQQVKCRDESLDHLRGFAMLWVIFVHVIFWGKIITDGYAYIVKTFILFEMPLFFFITGASNSMGKKYSYGAFVAKRYERCLIPYWVFAGICAIISAIYSIIQTGWNPLSVLRIFASWSLPIDRQISSVLYLRSALWFIPVYLCVVLMIPLFIRVKKAKFSWIFFCGLGVSFFATVMFKAGWIQNVLFYSIWTYIGLYYQEIKQAGKGEKRHVLYGLILLLVSLGVIFLMYKLGYSMNMQTNKFPPNSVFFFFSVVTMSFLYLIYPGLEKGLKRLAELKCIGKIFNVYCTKSLTIFLYQAFAFNITIPIMKCINMGNPVLTEICKIVVGFITTFLLSGILGIIFGKIESWSIISYIYKKKKK